MNSARRISRRAQGYHKKKDLGRAIRLYDRLLTKEPPQRPSEQQQVLAERFRPRIFACPDEPFALRDLAAMIHPVRPVIAYHLFWEDDIDFPADQEPSDHELCWVEYDPADGRIVRFLTYYHGRALVASESDESADRERPALFAQWGKHGSLPLGWERLDGGGVMNDMRRSYDRLHNEGTRYKGHPLARDWPDGYDGSWSAFIDFSVEIDPLDYLRAEGNVWVTERANAVLMRRVLRYNFSAKPQWPHDLPAVLASSGHISTDAGGEQ